MTTTIWDFAVSPVLNVRPRSSRMPIASKYPSLTGVNAADGSCDRSGAGLSATMKMEFHCDPSMGSAKVSAAFRTPGIAFTRSTTSA